MPFGFKMPVLASVLGCVLLLDMSPASAEFITLLRENFNDVLIAPGDVVPVATIDPAQLPAGTTFIGTPNVRGSDDVINTSFGNDGFHDFFTSNFLVLGDDSGQIGGNPSGPNEDSGIRFPFEIPVGAVGIQVRYRIAFNGIDTATNRFDQMSVRITGPGASQDSLILVAPFLFGAGPIDSFFDVFVDLDPATLSPGQYELQFRLNETANGDGRTNTAVGLDRIRIRAEVPEPASCLLLAGGLVALVWRRRSTRSI